MESLIYFLLWGALIFLMMRFGCGSHIMGHGHGQHGAHGTGTSRDQDRLRWVPPEKDADPVCGMTVQTDRAKSAVHDGHGLLLLLKQLPRPVRGGAATLCWGEGRARAKTDGAFPWLSHCTFPNIAGRERRW